MATKNLINKIIHADVLNGLKQLDDNSIDMVITSPPYWALRDYGVQGQLGLEPTFQEYIMKLCDIFDEAKRCLKKTGTLWVNLGDTYFGGGNNRGATEENLSEKQYSNRGARGQVQMKWPKDYPRKSLCMIPFRFALKMVDNGWILRNTIIWHKPNCMPSSVKDRFTIDFEYLFFFVKNKNYWFETQYEPHTSMEDYKRRSVKIKKGNLKHPRSDLHSDNNGNFRDRIEFYGEQGRNKRTMWTLTTQPFKGAHFAVFPEALVETPIKAGCPDFVCNKCGKAREKIYESEAVFRRGNKVRERNRGGRTDGYTVCNCNAGFSSGIVLDPFSGAGTTCLVAKKLGRKYIGIELKKEYIKMAEKRLAQVPEKLTNWIKGE